MPFLAKVSIDGSEEMNVLHCNFRFTQATDATGKPSSLPQGGYVSLTIESDKSTELFDWMIAPTGIKNGIITFFRRDIKSKMKTLEFSEAFCVDYSETFNHVDDNPMQITFTLSAKKLKLNDSEFENNRPETAG